MAAYDLRGGEKKTRIAIECVRRKNTRVSWIMCHLAGGVSLLLLNA